MSAPALSREQLETELRRDIAGFTHDPFGWVMYAFAWDSGQLKSKSGPDEWQRGILNDIRTELLAGATVQEAIQIAVASGHGVGKSALVSWIVLWAISTCEDTKGVVTANTENQLRTKTWPELAKWYRLMICRHWFRFEATSIHAVEPAHEKTWRIDAIPWSERNTEAFAGLHNEGKRILVVYDEASAIPDLIWETTEGALTDDNTEIIWLAFGNPTRNTGRFRECFGRLKHRWNHRQIDSRAVTITNKTQINRWIEDYGEDSDFVRVRVRGVFPRAGSMQFIAGDLADNAAKREVERFPSDAKVMGVDVSRFGDDETVIAFRQGRDARTIPWITMRGDPTQPGWLMTVAGRIHEEYERHGIDMVFVDQTGIGAGVVDRLSQLGVPVIGVDNGSSGGRVQLPSGDTIKVNNKGAEMWAKMRSAMAKCAIPDDPDLIDQLTGREYGYDSDDAIQLEKKKDMKKRGLSSPDRADALALTYAWPVQKGTGRSFERPRERNRTTGY